MEANQLLDLVKKYEENRDFITNEETAKLALVVPFIRLLGYPTESPREVRMEYAADFTQGDGKKLPDRMDFAIFDKNGAKPLIVIETKPLGTDLMSKSQQLARYIAQMADLHFGIITDGCHYLFFGDLESPNQMDREPFFSFSLDDPKADWAKVAKFLSKFSRDAFNAETLVTDAENSRYRQAMIDKLAAALKGPSTDEEFLKWLTADVYKGKRTQNVMERLGEVAREVVEPALLRVMGDDFVEKLKQRIHLAQDGQAEDAKAQNVPKTGAQSPFDGASGTEDRGGDIATKAVPETTAEELEFHRIARDICAKEGANPDEILARDTLNYFNVSYRRPTKWFLRFFSSGKRKTVVTLVPVEEVRALCSGFEVEPAPSVFGNSRITIDDVAQLWALKPVVLRSFELQKAAKEDGKADMMPSMSDATAPEKKA